MKLLQAIRGMNDILPQDMPYWHQCQASLSALCHQFAYQEIRLPVLEYTQLFARSLGDVTDVVEKEMYTFADRNGESLSLRPEGTAGCLRAAISHGLLHNQQQRLWYLGPMYRYERPQKGRYRQFYQFGLEALGFAGPDIDAELIGFAWQLWQQLGLSDHLQLQLNSLGTSQARQAHRQDLVSYFQQHHAELDADSQRRLVRNPLRILDSKNPQMADLLADAPQLLSYLDEASLNHFEQLQAKLTAANIPFRLNPRLVRGLDYYTHTVFEWVTDQLGAQGTVCGGGRYDGLVEQLGGKATPGAGFSMGLERIIALKQAIAPLTESSTVDVYLILLGETVQQHSLVLARQLRARLPGLSIQVNLDGGSVKNQFKKAARSGADYALVVGEQEWANQQVSVKNLHSGEQQLYALSTLSIQQLTALKQKDLL